MNIKNTNINLTYLYFCSFAKIWETSPEVSTKEDFGWKEPVAMIYVIGLINYMYIMRAALGWRRRPTYLPISIGGLVVTVVYEENENNNNSTTKRVLNYFLFLYCIFFAIISFFGVFFYTYIVCLYRLSGVKVLYEVGSVRVFQ